MNHYAHHGGGVLELTGAYAAYGPLFQEQSGLSVGIMRIRYIQDKHVVKLGVLILRGFSNANINQALISQMFYLYTGNFAFLFPRFLGRSLEFFSFRRGRSNFRGRLTFPNLFGE